jgi:hypothetical protein
MINLYRDADPKKKKDRPQIIGYVNINTSQILSRHPVERWYTITPGTEPSVRDRLSLGSRNNNDPPAMRIKARFQAVDILPLNNYNKLLDFIKEFYLPLCLHLEPILGVKAKEDLATSLVRILHKQQLAESFLCNLIMSEVEVLDNEHLMFRGNSLATKSMEAYMKLVASEYLKCTLNEFIKTILEKNIDCEVDPTKLSNQSNLEKNRSMLMAFVRMAWASIQDKAHLFPEELRKVFKSIRERLSDAGRSELADNLISSSIFLRFLCPAILSPSLFNLVLEYPTGQASRSLTLIAKTLQTLANFTKFGGKESYMEFMNEFIRREWDNMHDFLVCISTKSDSMTPTTPSGDCTNVDLGKELSLLHSYLEEVWTPEIHESACRNNKEDLAQLSLILKDIRSRYHRSPTPSNLSTTTNGTPSDYENNSGRPTSSSRHSTISTSNSNNQNQNQRIQAAPSLNTNDDYVLQSAVDTSLSENVLKTGYHVQQMRKLRATAATSIPKTPLHAVQPHPNLGVYHRQQSDSRGAYISTYDENYAAHTPITTTTTIPPTATAAANRYIVKHDPVRVQNPKTREYMIYDDSSPSTFQTHLYDAVPIRSTVGSNGIRVHTGIESDSDDSLENNQRRPPPQRRNKRRSESVSTQLPSSMTTPIVGGVGARIASSSGYQSQNNSSSNSSSPIDNSTPRALTISNPRYLAASTSTTSSSSSSSTSPPNNNNNCIISSSKPSISTTNEVFDDLLHKRPTSPYHTYLTSSSGVESASATMRTTSSESSQSSFERIPGNQHRLPRMGINQNAQRHPKLQTVVNVLEDDDEQQPPSPPQRRLTGSMSTGRSVENLMLTNKELEDQVRKLTHENQKLRQQLAAGVSLQNLAH